MLLNFLLNYYVSWKNELTSIIYGIAKWCMHGWLWV